MSEPIVPWWDRTVFRVINALMQHLRRRALARGQTEVNFPGGAKLTTPPYRLEK